MSDRARDPWMGEKMSRSDAQRRYTNLVTYQLRPMLADRRLDEDGKISILKKMIREASRFKYESGVVAGGGCREELVDLLAPWLKPEAETSDELRDWVKRTMRAFGATVESSE